MRVVKTLSIAFVVVCACSAMAAVSASAHEFEASKTGLLLASADGLQVFKTPAGTVECEKLTGHGFVKTIKTLTQIATVAYTGCKTSFGAPDEPISAEYEFSADGTVNILKPINVFILSVACHIVIPVQSGLGTVSYDNNASGDILILSKVTGITSSGLGLGCTYATNKEGTYTGNALALLDGGTIKWV